MKAQTMIVNGQSITGKNYGDLRRQLQALGLTPEMMTNYVNVAKQLFPKTDDAGSSKQRHGNRGNRNGRRQSQDKTMVVRQEMNFHGVDLEVFEGPTSRVLKQARGRGRNIIVIGTESFTKNGNTVLVALKGRYDKVQYGRIDKDALVTHLARPGYSFLSAIKATGDRRNGVNYQAVGTNLALPNMRFLAQQLAKVLYNAGEYVIGGKIGEKEISTILFFTTDTAARQAASWPASNPDAYAVVDIGSDPVTFIGDHGLVQVTREGMIRGLAFAAVFAAGITSLLSKAAKIVEVPWSRIEQLDLKKLGGKILDVAIAQSIPGKNAFQVFVTGLGQVAILEVSWKDNQFSIGQKIEYKPFQNADMAFMARANEQTVVLVNRNGGATALEFAPAADFKELGIMPFSAATPASVPTAQA